MRQNSSQDQADHQPQAPGHGQAQLPTCLHVHFPSRPCVSVLSNWVSALRFPGVLGSPVETLAPELSKGLTPFSEEEDEREGCSRGRRCRSSTSSGHTLGGAPPSPVACRLPSGQL